MTLRESFFSDPFFERSWDGFDRVRDEMGKESKDFWEANDESSEFKQVRSTFL